MPRIALIHAVREAIEPVRHAFAAEWPAAQTVNILDDSLSGDRARDEALSAAMTRRIADLAAYGLGAGAQAILFTCSAFGPAIEAVARAASVPVLKPNEAMFAAALARGRRIGMVATFRPSVASMETEFHQQAAASGSAATLRTELAADAMEALRGGDVERHNALVAEAATRLDDCDLLLLAQFSTSRALAAVEARCAQPILTSPQSAVRMLRTRLEG